MTLMLNDNSEKSNNYLNKVYVEDNIRYNSK